MAWFPWSPKSASPSALSPCRCRARDPHVPARSIEIVVERENLADPNAVHDHERRAIRQRVRDVRILSEHLPRGFLRFSVDPLQTHDAASQLVSQFDLFLGLPREPSQKLCEHVRRGNELVVFPATDPSGNGLSCRVVLVIRFLEGDERPGIDEKTASHGLLGTIVIDRAALPARPDRPFAEGEGCISRRVAKMGFQKRSN